MDELNKAVLKALATEFVFYMKAHGFHWNLKDKNFPEFHEFFGDIYSEVYGSIDGFAERCRTLQIAVPGSLAGMLAIAGISEQAGVPSKDAMVSELLADNEVIINILKEAYNLCDIYGKFGFENFLAERIDAHEKHGWMLRSSI